MDRWWKMTTPSWGFRPPSFGTIPRARRSPPNKPSPSPKLSTQPWHVVTLLTEAACRRESGSDLVVLDRNPLASDPSALSEIRVELTYLGGELVYER